MFGIDYYDAILLSGEYQVKVTAEYFYYDNIYIKSISTHGSLESITYYK